MTKFELIDKNALIRKFCAECQHCYRVDKAGGEPTMCKIVMMIAEMPTIEPEVRHGRWTKDGCEYRYFYYKCNACGFVNDARSKYCPHCGAKMDLLTQTEAALDIADSVMMGGADNG